jgi:hypothetical protein
VARFINRWEKNRMMNKNQGPQSWRDQHLGRCPYKPISKLVAVGNGEPTTSACDGPKCQLWLRQEAREDSPGNCAHVIGALNAAQTASVMHPIAGLIQNIGQLVHMSVRLMTKATPALAEDYAKILADEAKIAEQIAGEQASA